jgi:soluble lytic murein transglycosylase-like protein
MYRNSALRMPDGPRADVTTWVDNITPISPQAAYEAAIVEAAERYRLDPALIRSVIQIESAFDALAVSPVGAQGLMQLMPEVAEEMGVADPFNPRENIMGGARLLRNLLNHFKGNVRLTLAGYNAGPGAVKRFRGRIPPFRETQNYVKRITRLMADNRADGD